MQLKANLHLHTNDDPEDLVTYSIYDAIDAAALHGFDVLAITCHNRCAWCPAYAHYAQKRGIVLLSGIEATLSEKPKQKGRHVLLLGVDQSAEKLRTFNDLAAYRATHPEMVVIAPHPFFDPFLSLQSWTERYIELFDAIEHAWFYSRWCNRNKKALQLADKYQKPVVATSDTHFLDYLPDHYTYIETTERTSKAVLAAIKTGHVQYHTRPHAFWREMIWPQTRFTLRTLLWRTGLYRPSTTEMNT